MNEAGEDEAIGTRWPELLLGLLLLGIAVLVIADSLRVGTGWGDDGPRSGYFPFYIGLLLAASSGWIVVKQLLNWKQREPFAHRSQLLLVWAVLWPMTVFVGIVALMGIYVAAVVLIAYFMLRHGKHKVALAAAVALGVPLACFLVFERWFLVPLPKGPLEALIGL
jgi:putative tricarboxylic transport membrane protein